MKMAHAILAATMLAFGGVAVAKLPPPTPEEQEKAAQGREKAKAAAAAQEEATLRAQDRVAQRYIAEQKAKGITVNPTPITGEANAAVTTAQGNTPATSTPGESPERKAADKGGRGGGDATGPDASKDTHKGR